VTKKLLSKVILKTLGQEIRSYSFTYDDPSFPISHLVSIGESSQILDLPKINFTYGEGQFRHMITKVDNNR